MSNESPINTIPPVIIVLTLLIVMVEAAMSLAATGMIGGQQGIGWRLFALQDYAFSPAVLDRMIERGDFAPALLKRFFTYPFIHASFTHALFTGALLLALGKFVAEVFSAAATLLVFFGSAIVGAVSFGLLVNGNAPLFGAWPPIYGLIGAYTYILWLRLGASGQSQLAAFRLIAFLLGLQLVFGLIFGGSLQWIAELTGFFTGFGLSVIVAPGGWTALVTRLRRRS